MPWPVFILQSCSYHTAIMQLSYSYHTGIMPKPVHSCRIRFAGIDGYRQQKKKYRHRAGAGEDGMPHRSRAGAKEEDLEPNTKPKPDSRGLEGIQGYPHKESAHHHPYNQPRKRYSPPLIVILFPI